MGKVVATYNVKVTLREPDKAGGTKDVPAIPPEQLEPPTIETVTDGIAALFAVGTLVPHVSAERTDK